MHPERKEIGHEIRVIQRMLHHKIEAFRAENGDTLTFVQTRTLSFLLKHPDKDMFQKDLEKELNIRRSTATEILNVLERDGYIERQSVCGDKRLKKLVPTQKAIDLGTRAMNHIQLMESTLSKGISSEDLETFYRVTDQIKKNLKGEDQHD
ncbi:MAG: MarR family transcriptional regulator [Erysipelotrichaceae bacterium]|nr:MarR family transcriptional regulator [Erysipelotrichaceae bacterium]